MKDDHRDEETRTATVQAEQPKDPIAPAQRMGRYLVLSQVGRGAMGEVYAAYDPKLDRRVALKVLRQTDGPKERKRFLREAKALARISHPNVLTVHEVEEIGEQVIIALEFVSGGTLKDWLQKHPPGGEERLREALELLVQAGKGLMAAHAEGLIHRDFKPSNVLVGHDGRVRVADFGLARRSVDVTQDDEELDEARSRTSDAVVDPRVTQTGQVAGTPAYMAPEQWSGGELDARTDQFSFCVVAWEVLFGVRPFERDTVAGRLAAVKAGSPQIVDGVEESERLAAALKNGLAFRRESRRRDLRDVVGALELELARLGGDVEQKRGWFPWKSLGVVGLGVGLYFGGREANEWRIEQQCRSEAEDALAEVWNDQERAAAREGIVATGLKDAASVADNALATLDEKGADWVEDSRTMCIKRESGIWEASTATRTEYCLFRVAGRIQWLSNQFKQSNPNIVTAAELHTSSIATPGACTSTDTTRTHTPPPPRANWTTIQSLQQEARTITVTSNATATQVERLKEIDSHIHELGGSRGTKKQIAQKLQQLGLGKQAVKMGQDAFLDAVSNGAWHEAAELATTVGHSLSLDLSRHDEALLWVALADTALRRAPSAGPSQRHRIAQTKTNILLHADRGEEALDAAQRQIEAATEAQDGDPSALGLSLLNLANALNLIEQYGPALRVIDIATEKMRASLGPKHPNIGQALVSGAMLSSRAGNTEQLQARLQRAVNFYDTTNTHPPWMPTLFAILGKTHIKTGETPEAVAYLKQSIKRCSQAPSCEALTGTYIRTMSLQAVLRQESSTDTQEFRHLLLGALDNDISADARFAAYIVLAHASLVEGDTHTALKYARRAAELGGEDPEKRGSASRTLGICEWAAGNRAAGEKLLRESIEHDKNPLQHDELGAATTQFALARLLWDAGEQGDETVQLVVSAREVLLTQPNRFLEWSLDLDEAAFALQDSTEWLRSRGLLEQDEG